MVWGWLMRLFGRGPREVDEVALREEMAREDPDYARVREVQHDALGLLGGPSLERQIRDRWNERVRESWRHGSRGS